MSLVISSEGRRLNSSHVHLLGSSTSPTTEKSHSARGVRGVRPAERTGKPSSRYWPGGSFVSCPRRRPPKPREINPLRMFRPSSLVRVPLGPCESPLIGGLSSRPTAPVGCRRARRVVCHLPAWSPHRSSSRATPLLRGDVCLVLRRESQRPGPDGADHLGER